jgi:trehalose 6-phosphate phosphatase
MNNFACGVHPEFALYLILGAQMKYVFSEPKVIEKFSKPKTILIFDYDGTLCKLYLKPGSAILLPETRGLLNELVSLYPCAVLSGRGLRDLEKKVQGIPFQALVGNHGMEFSNSKLPVAYAKRVLKWKAQLEKALQDGTIEPDNIQLEMKTVTLSIHYRTSTNPKRADKQIRAFLDQLDGVRIVGGKYVYNLLPSVSKNKGTAVLTLAKKFRCDRIVYVGDDTTDEDVFELKKKSNVFDIRVEKSKKSKARYFLKKQEEVNVLLKKLIKLRRSEDLKAPK